MDCALSTLENEREGFSGEAFSTRFNRKATEITSERKMERERKKREEEKRAKKTGKYDRVRLKGMIRRRVGHFFGRAFSSDSHLLARHDRRCSLFSSRFTRLIPSAIICQQSFPCDHQRVGLVKGVFLDLSFRDLFSSV